MTVFLQSILSTAWIALLIFRVFIKFRVQCTHVRPFRHLFQLTRVHHRLYVAWMRLLNWRRADNNRCSRWTTVRTAIRSTEDNIWVWISSMILWVCLVRLARILDIPIWSTSRWVYKDGISVGDVFLSVQHQIKLILHSHTVHVQKHLAKDIVTA